MIGGGNDHPSLEEFETLFVNNPDLEAIGAHLNRFNPIKTMGMERMEIRHSAILAWLLSPQETHGLGDAFLKAFLAAALRGDRSGALPSALDVSQADLMDTEVRKEWRNIDLLMLSQRNGWIFIIENKFDSRQHSNQLARYMDVVHEAFGEGDGFRHIRGVFLSLWDEEPNDCRYAPIQYATLTELLDQQAFSGRRALAEDVRTFLRHYRDILLEATDMSPEQKKFEALARQLYRDNKKVLDFIVGHGSRTDFVMACEDVFGPDIDYAIETKVDRRSYVMNAAVSQNVSFLPKSWFEAFGGDQFWWHGCEYWWAGFPVIMWLQLTIDADGARGQVRLYAEVGPLADHDFRRELIEAIQATAGKHGFKRIGFQRGAGDEGKKYSKFLKDNVERIDDVNDGDKIANAARKLLKSFAPEIDAIAEVLPQFLHHGKAEISQ